MKNINEISEGNKLIHRIMKDETSSFEEFQLVSLMANKIITKTEVENTIDLKQLCEKHNIDYDKL